jgi:parallel beta-helix repeat protein
MKGIWNAHQGIISVLAAVLVSITRRLPARRLSSGITTLTLAGIILLVAAGSMSAAPCPAPGDTVIVASCELDQNWNVPAGQAGYIIQADGIVIDGAGYMMTGTTTAANCEWAGEAAPCTVSGIYNAGFDDVGIKNLGIEGFCTGIALAGAGANKVRNNIIDNCSIHDNGFNTMSSGGEMVTHGIHACWVEAGAGGEPALTITDNDIYNNEGTGTACGDGGNGIFIYAGSPDAKQEKCEISYNNIHDNAKAGFWTKMMLSRSNITYNEVWGNGNGTGVSDDVRGGIVLRCKKSDENYIAYNDVHDHVAEGYGYGIYVGGGSNTIEYNTVTGNTMHGISMARSDGSVNNELYENTVCDNGVDISTFGPTSNTIGDDNTCDTTSSYDDTGATGCTYSCETSPPTPFVIYGWVNCTDGSPVNDPNVTVTNTNTSDAFIAETNASSNYYRVLTSSDYVSAGNVLHFVVSNSNSIEFDHTVTSVEMGAGGFTQNATIECGSAGICGDVNDDGDVNMADVMTLWYDIADYPASGVWTISNAWAADVNCDGDLNMADVMTLWYDIADYPTSGDWVIGCC